MKPRPVNSAIVVRSFRGSQLYLTDISRAAKYWRWTSDKTQALRFDPSYALGLAEEASRQWGAECATQDAQGNLARIMKSTYEELTPILEQFYAEGKFQYVKFLAEMTERNGGAFTELALRKLARTVKAFIAVKELEAIKKARTTRASRRAQV